MTRRTLVAVVAMAMGAGLAQAQFTYIDAVDATSHPSAGGGANTFLSGGAEWTTDTSGAAGVWRFRDTGPGAVAAGGNAYEGRADDPDIFTRITGLTPGEAYTISLYGVWTTRNASWGLAYSLDGGNNWSESIDSLDIDGAVGSGFGQGWVDTDGNPISVVYGEATDTRGSLIIGNTLADSSGIIEVGIRAMPNASGERGVYDGIGWAAGIVPEPSSFALAGLGAAAMLMLRRRK